MSHRRLIAGVAVSAIAVGGIAVGFTNPLANAVPPEKPTKTLTLQTQQVDVGVTVNAYGVASAQPVCPAGTKPIGGAWDMDLGTLDTAYIAVNQLSPYTENAWWVMVTGLPVSSQVYLGTICASVSGG